MRRLTTLLLIIGITGNAYAAGAPVRIDGGSTLVPKSDIAVTTTAALIAAANSLRAFLNCTVTENVRWGSSAVTVTKGQRVQANSTISIANTGAVYMIAELDTATVSCTEETFTSGSGGGIFSP